jgi:hypothetical protein
MRVAYLIGLVVIAYGSTVGVAGAAMPALYKNCGNLNARYPHGLGRVSARDETAGEQVTNFRRK